MTCYCCGQVYEQGQWRCCAPPAGMASERWMEGYCKPVKEGGCGKCPKHCECRPPVVGPDANEETRRLFAASNRRAALRQMANRFIKGMP